MWVPVAVWQVRLRTDISVYFTLLSTRARVKTESVVQRAHQAQLGSRWCSKQWRDVDVVGVERGTYDVRRCAQSYSVVIVVAEWLSTVHGRQQAAARTRHQLSQIMCCSNVWPVPQLPAYFLCMFTKAARRGPVRRDVLPSWATTRWRRRRRLTRNIQCTTSYWHRCHRRRRRRVALDGRRTDVDTVRPRRRRAPTTISLRLRASTNAVLDSIVKRRRRHSSSLLTAKIANTAGKVSTCHTHPPTVLMSAEIR